MCSGQMAGSPHGYTERQGKKKNGSGHTHTYGQLGLDRMLGRQPRSRNPTSSGDTDWAVSVGGMAPLSQPLASRTKRFGLWDYSF